MPDWPPLPLQSAIFAFGPERLKLQQSIRLFGVIFCLLFSWHLLPRQLQLNLIWSVSVFRCHDLIQFRFADLFWLFDLALWH